MPPLVGSPTREWQLGYKMRQYAGAPPFTRDVAKSRSGISSRIIVFADSAELLGEAHFNQALIGDILSIGLLLDAPQQ